MNILCDTNAEPLFDGDDTSADELLRGAAMRNAHLESETGAVLSVTATSDFYTAAKNDILAGAYEYDLYAATATGGLSRLLSDGSLYDVSASPYIDLDASCYDQKTMESLSLFGGTYLISSSAADARWWSAALVYDTSLVGREEIEQLVHDGGFTVGEMLECGGLLYGEEDIYPLFFGVGGSFARTTSDGCEFISLSDFTQAVNSVCAITENDDGKTDVFAVQTMFETRHEGLGILPLPKAGEYDVYSGYIDLSEAVLLAIPSGSPQRNKTECLVHRMATLSEEYVTPYFEAKFADDMDMYDIITEGASCDLSVLFDYGDMGGLVAKCMRDDTRLTLEYYNRKALYEKAISIIEKRLCPEE